MGVWSIDDGGFWTDRKAFALTQVPAPGSVDKEGSLCHHFRVLPFRPCALPELAAAFWETQNVTGSITAE